VLVGNAGALVTRVLYRKSTEAKNFVIVDAGMNDLMRPSLYGAYHEIRPEHKRDAGEFVADVVGPICETGDFLARDRKMAIPERGDLLAVMSAGAYGYTMSSTYNSRTRPAEVMVNGSGYHVVRSRDEVSDLTRGEVVPDFLSD